MAASIGRCFPKLDALEQRLSLELYHFLAKGPVPRGTLAERLQTPVETVSRWLGDWFAFEVGEPAEAATGAPRRGFRFPIRCPLDGRPFETFHLDVGYGDPILEALVELIAPSLLAFAEIAPARVRCYPLTTQIAGETAHPSILLILNSGKVIGTKSRLLPNYR